MRLKIRAGLLGIIGASAFAVVAFNGDSPEVRDASDQPQLDGAEVMETSQQLIVDATSETLEQVNDYAFSHAKIEFGPNPTSDITDERSPAENFSDEVVEYATRSADDRDFYNKNQPFETPVDDDDDDDGLGSIQFYLPPKDSTTVRPPGVGFAPGK